MQYVIAMILQLWMPQMILNKKKTLQITFIVHFRKCYTLKPLDCYHDETKFVFYGFVISHLSSTTHIQHKWGTNG